MAATERRGAEVGLLVAALVAGAWLRLHALEPPRMSPDEGSYLWSAGVHELRRDTGFGERLAEDLEWAWPRYWPHSYLHQLATRWIYRSGASAVASVRLDSVALGLATALAAFALARSVLGARPPDGGAAPRPGALAGAAFAGAVVAVQCLHVWYSRTGWGQTGCTFFYALYLALGYRLFGAANGARRDALLAAGMAAAALLAWGWHEMVAVHVAGMGVFVLLQHVLGGPGIGGAGWRGTPGRLARSRKAWVALASALPVAVLFVSLWTSDFARENWIDFEREGRAGFGENVAGILGYLFAKTHVERQLSWPVLLLALAGALSLRRRDRFAFRYLLTALATSVLLFVLFFKDAFLVRIYLPSALVLALLAGEGLVALAALLGSGRARPVALGVGTLLATWMALVSARTLFGPPEGPLFVREFHAPVGNPVREWRDTLGGSAALLRQRLRPGERVGVDAAQLLFRLQDDGVPVYRHPFAAPRSEWPRLVMALAHKMDAAHRTVERGGPYRLLELDPYGRFGVYERVRP